MKTITVSTADLTGAALDWAVAVAVERFEPSIVPVAASHAGAIKFSILVNEWRYSPSTDWSQGGPLIEQFGVDIEKDHDWSAFCLVHASDVTIERAATMDGATPLIAACRAIVAAKLGDTVDVPEVLL
jgi:hypothetical protein